MEGLWGENAPPTAQRSLDSYISRLRALVGADRVVRHAPGYSFRVEDGELDLAHFEHLVERGSQSTWDRAEGCALRSSGRHGAVARACARRPARRAVRPSRGRPARGSARVCRRGTPRDHARPRRRARSCGRARGTHPAGATPRAPTRTADDRALPVGTGGGGARGVPVVSAPPRGRTRTRARPVAARPPAADSRTRPDACAAHDPAEPAESTPKAIALPPRPGSGRHCRYRRRDRPARGQIGNAAHGLELRGAGRGQRTVARGIRAPGLHPRRFDIGRRVGLGDRARCLRDRPDRP